MSDHSNDIGGASSYRAGYRHPTDARVDDLLGQGTVVQYLSGVSASDGQTIDTNAKIRTVSDLLDNIENQLRGIHNEAVSVRENVIGPELKNVEAMKQAGYPLTSCVFDRLERLDRALPEILHLIHEANRALL
jgi:hypothetical protein